MSDRVTLDLGGAVAAVTLNGLRQRNAINEALLKALDRVLESLPDQTRAIVLAGNGPHFGSGPDLEEQRGLERMAVQFMRAGQARAARKMARACRQNCYFGNG